ncbi:putative membrane protein YccC [Streptomyces umbrinus]|uniref:Membrane protein YccC n=1 Tax=Streptomyces umbrinus TaxID=67370 RepID=A0ABU0T2U3_9ACTN|nr:putative membrane protein YccC [Streptomyces umbrinus]
MPRPFSVALPPWLTHALRAQRGPVPWNAVVRGALAAGPLLLAAVLAGRESIGVMAALGAMLAGINDRPGSRRTAVHRIGVPGLAGAAGLVVGTYAGEGLGAVPLTLILTALGLVAGAVSAVGPVSSGAGTQLLVAAAIGAGMPLPEPGWQRALFFLAGAAWLIALRLVLPTPGALAHDFRFDGERVAVADVYDAIAELLAAAGGEQAGARRAALTAALDHAQDALAGPRLRRYASSSAERRLRAQYAAALPLAEAATALAWAGDALPARTAEGPRRLAVAVRTGEPCGPLPAPARSVPGLRALDDALLHAAETFDRGGKQTGSRRIDGEKTRSDNADDKRGAAPRSDVDAAPHSDTGTNPLDRGARQTAHKGLRLRPFRTKALFRTVTGQGGREYGFRVALCYGASAAVAQALHHVHWYWLPATAVFLVKPDLGPLVSRVLNRAAGTVLGALVFAGFAAVLPRPEGLVALVAISGALIPVATRHFAAQTAVVTVLVLALVMVGGEPEASWSRIGETLLACAIVLIVGHLPTPGQRGGNVRARLDAATDAAHAYLTHVLSGADDRAARWALRREAYRKLAEARAAIDRAAAELPTLARHTEGTDEVAATLERLVDTTTASAVHLDDTGRLTPRHTERLATLLDELVEQRERAGLADPPADLLSA